MRRSACLAFIFALGCTVDPPKAESKPDWTAPEVSGAPLDLAKFELPGAIRRDWLEQDLELFSQFASMFPLTDLSAALLVFAAVDDSCKPISQGLGIDVYACHLWGGYTSCMLDAVARDGVSLEATASCTSSKADWEVLEPVFIEFDAATLGPKGFVRDRNTARLEFEDPDASAEARAVVAAKLGPLSGAEVLEPLRDAYELLTSPRHLITVGSNCTLNGSAMLGNNSLQALVGAERADLLRDAMRGLNAGGRIYGYIGLRLLGVNDSDDDALFERIRELDVLVATCGGFKLDEPLASHVVETFRPR